MDQDNILMENELERSDRNPLELSNNSTSCRTPTPEIDTNFIAWRNPMMSVDDADSAGSSSPNHSEIDESPEQVKESLQRDLEFIKKYALDAESDVLYSLLLSEAHNPNRLEFVMHDMLGLPNVPQLVAEYKKSNYKTGDKRSSEMLINDSADVKKRKVTFPEPAFNAGIGIVPQASSSEDSSSRNELTTVNDPKASSSGESSSNNESTVANEPQASSSGECSSRIQESLQQVDSQNKESSNSQKNKDQNGESSKQPQQSNRLENPEIIKEVKNKFLDSLKDMFPDADGLFLISQSQHIESWDECSRFINTVMLSGLYPKKGAKDDSWKVVTVDSDDDITEIPNNSVYRPSSAAQSDGETVDSNDNDDEELVVLSKKIVKPNGKQMKLNEPKIGDLIDFGNDKEDKTNVSEKKETSSGAMVVELLNDETMMTVSSNDSNSTETYDLPDVPVLPASNFDQLMADELDFLLGDLNEPRADLPNPNVPTTSVLRATKIKNQKQSPEVNNLDVEMESVSSTWEDLRNAEQDELDSILQAPGPSQNVPKIIKGKEKHKEKDLVAEGEKIVEEAKKIFETAKSLVQKEISPTKVKLPPAEKPKNRWLKSKPSVEEASIPQVIHVEMHENEGKEINSLVPNVTVAAQPSTSKTITKVPESAISSANSNSSLNQKVKTPPPGPSTASTSRPKIELVKPDTADEEMTEVAETVTNKPETVKSAEEEKAAKESKWIDEQTANLVRIFPNTDPTFLKAECAKMECSDATLNEFVVAKLEQNDMPTRAEYEKRIEMEELQNRYTKNFVIQDFLKAIPDPWTYFSDSKRNCTKYKQHSLCYLKSSFRKHLMKDITDALNKNNYNLYLAYQHLTKNVVRQRCAKRTDFECSNNRPTTIDIQFLQEVAFIENEKKIKDYLEAQRLEKEAKFEEARRTNSLLECQCCFDNEVLVEDTVYCPNDHNFCSNCVVRSVEVEMGNGRHQFNCLESCDSQFTLSSLQSVLKPEVFSKVIQAIQMEEIKAAGIEGLVSCPFCNYATILPPEEKVMTCLNPECLKESCRLCKELNHIPLRCEEVEKSEDIKLRTYIENKMTEALVRTCYKCNKKFVKEDGCNKMTCTCGAKMCYVCRQPVTDYSHFNGQGGTDFSKCPLYSTNDELHVDAVKKVAEQAKQEVLKKNPEGKLVHDPTMILPERRNDPLMPGMVRPGDAQRLHVNVMGANVNVIGAPPIAGQQFNAQMPPVQLQPLRPPLAHQHAFQDHPARAIREELDNFQDILNRVHQGYNAPPFPLRHAPPAAQVPPRGAPPVRPAVTVRAPNQQRPLPAHQPVRAVRAAQDNHRRHRHHHQAAPHRHYYDANGHRVVPRQD